MADCAEREQWPLSTGWAGPLDKKACSFSSVTSSRPPPPASPLPSPRSPCPPHPREWQVTVPGSSFPGFSQSHSWRASEGGCVTAPLIGAGTGMQRRTGSHRPVAGSVTPPWLRGALHRTSTPSLAVLLFKMPGSLFTEKDASFSGTLNCFFNLSNIRMRSSSGTFPIQERLSHWLAPALLILLV